MGVTWSPDGSRCPICAGPGRGSTQHPTCERPGAGMADHVLWLDDPDPRVPATGGFVLFYHLLWELTHVCFEHSGLLKPEDSEDELHDYTSEWTLRGIIKKYSDYVAYPIKLKVEKHKDDKKKDEPAEYEWETVNSMKAIWRRPK